MKVIIEDSSAVVRAIIEQNLKTYPEIEIIASVPNFKKLVYAIENERPEVVISGVDINEHNEQANLKSLLYDFHIPVLILTEDTSSMTSNEISEIIEKPNLSSYTKEFFEELVTKLQKLASSPVNMSCGSDPKASFKILCIGASTGGPSAVSEVLQGLGNDFPLPILYAQHIEIGTDKNMAHWFSNVCHNVRVKLAEDGEEAVAGTVYMAPADKHLVVDYLRPNGKPVLKLSDEAPERFLRPAVNKLFRSVAGLYKKNCLAILLTGMGADGAEGCKMICENGGWTIAEDKSTCAVFGMPAAAIEMGGAKEVLPRGKISQRILELVKE